MWRTPDFHAASALHHVPSSAPSFSVAGPTRMSPGKKINIVVGLGHEGKGRGVQGRQSCPSLSCCAWFHNKPPGPQAKKGVPRPFNVHRDALNSSILAFAKDFEPQPAPILWPERHGKEANPGTLFLYNNLAASKSRKYSLFVFFFIDKGHATELIQPARPLLPPPQTESSPWVSRQRLSCISEHCNPFFQ